MGRLCGISMLVHLKLEVLRGSGNLRTFVDNALESYTELLAIIEWQYRVVVVEAASHPIRSYLGSFEVRLRTYHGEQSARDSCRSNCAKNDQPEKTSTVLPRSHLQQGLLCFDRHC